MGEKQELWQQIKDGESEAVEALLLQYRPLVRRLVYSFGCGDKQDLEQSGMEGLLKAARKFDADFGVGFGTYALPFVKGEMCRCLENSLGHKKNRYSLMKKIRCGEDDLLQALGRSPSLNELGNYLGLSPETILSIEGESQLSASLDDEEAELTFEDNGFEEAENTIFIADLMKKLSPKEQNLLEDCFFNNLSQKEIGMKIGVSQAQVSRLIRSAVDKMKRGAKG